MLRISFSRLKLVDRWTLCGQLAGAWVKELRSCWEHSRRAAVGREAVVDLSDVTFIDEEGEDLLSEMHHAGARFEATGIETKHMIENLRSRSPRTLRRLI